MKCFPDNIPEELKHLDQWVCANDDSKVPMMAFSNEPASSTNRGTWSDFQTAVASCEKGYYDYLGFVFAGNGIVGIDIDDGYDEDGFLSGTAADIIGKCRSYTETSKSGRGFHILLHGSLPFKGRNNLKGVEIYQQSRYFILTGKIMLYKELVSNQAAIDYVIEHYFPDYKESTQHDIKDRIYNPIWEEPIKDGRITLRPVYPKIPNGSRNICLTSLAGLLHSLGYNKKQIYSELLYANQSACEPPLDNSELRSICNSIARYKR